MIGDVPEGWRVEKIRDIVKIKKGKKVDIFEEYKNGLFNYIDISVLRTKKYKYTNNSQIMATDKDILIVWDGANSGYSSFGLNGAVGSTLAKLSLNDESILHTYFGKFIFSKFKYLSDTSYGATIPHLQRQMLENISVPIPPLPQQEKIVKVLDISSELIEKQKGLIEKYDLFLKSKFIEMFGDPAKNPMGWEIKTIEKIVKKEKGSIKRGPFGGALKKEIFVKEGYLVYEQFHALNNDFSMERYFINEEKFAELKGFEVKSGDIIISCSGVYLGKLAIVPPNNKKGIINQALLKISLDENKMKNILFTYIFTNVNFKKRFFGTHIGSGVPNFPPMSDFKKFKFISPPIKLQEKFVTIVEKIEIIKTKETKKLKQLETLHSSLMDKAFKGEIA